MTVSSHPVARCNMRWIPLPAGEVHDATGGDGQAQWLSEGDDPQFHIMPDAPVAAGWYRVLATMQALDGQRLEPCFYPDYGRGISEATRVSLRHVHGSRMLDSVFCLGEDAHMLRFDPMACMGRFVLGEFKVERLAGREASWLMLRQLLGSLRRRSPLEAARLASSVRVQRELGCEEALAFLWARYTDDPGAQDALYQEWLANQEAIPGPAFEPRIANDAPAFSLVLLDSRSRGASVEDCIESVRSQTHPGWELLVSDASPVAAYVAEKAAVDERIRLLPPSDGGTADWMKRAAEAAHGRQIMFLETTGRLHKYALAGFAECLQAVPRASMLYGDEDFLDADQVRHSPYFKPDWNPELLLSQDYVSRAMMLDAGLAREVLADGLLAGAEVYDLALRCSARLGDEEIVHLPRIVRHDIGSSGFGQPEAFALGGVLEREAMVLAVSGHLEQQGIQAEVEAVPQGRRVRYSPPTTPVCVDIVIPTRDRIDLLSRCIDSVLEKTSWPDYRIIVVDNGSRQPESIDYLSRMRRHERLRVLAYDHPFNYSAINNFAAGQSDADVLVLLNNDIEVITPDWLTELVVLAMRPGTGAVGAKLYYPDDTIQHAGVILGVKGVAAHPYLRQRRDYPGQFGRALLAQNFSAVTAACLAVRRTIFEEVDGLDETIAVAFNDVDFCMRLQSRGYRNVWTPYSELYHHESATRGYEDDPVKQARFASEVNIMRKRWARQLDDDPAYSRNLSLVGNPFDIDPRRAFSSKDMFSSSPGLSDGGGREGIRGSGARSSRL